MSSAFSWLCGSPAAWVWKRGQHSIESAISPIGERLVGSGVIDEFGLTNFRSSGYAAMHLTSTKERNNGCAVLLRGGNKHHQLERIGFMRSRHLNIDWFYTSSRLATYAFSARVIMTLGLAITLLASSPPVRAVDPPPGGGYGNGNTALGTD